MRASAFIRGSLHCQYRRQGPRNSALPTTGPRVIMFPKIVGLIVSGAEGPEAEAFSASRCEGRVGAAVDGSGKALKYATALWSRASVRWILVASTKRTEMAASPMKSRLRIILSLVLLLGTLLLVVRSHGVPIEWLHQKGGVSTVVTCRAGELSVTRYHIEKRASGTETRAVDLWILSYRHWRIGGISRFDAPTIRGLEEALQTAMERTQAIRVEAGWATSRPTLSLRTFSVSAWTPAVLIAIWLALALVRGSLRRYRRLRQRLCVNCGYNLKGAASIVCSECGELIRSIRSI